MNRFRLILFLLFFTEFSTGFAQKSPEIIFKENYLNDGNVLREIKLSPNNKYILIDGYYDFKVVKLINGDLVYSDQINNVFAYDFSKDSEHIIVVDSTEIKIINFKKQSIIKTIPYELKELTFGCIYLPESNQLLEIFSYRKSTSIFCRYFNLTTKIFSKETLIGKTEREILSGGITFSDDKRESIFITVQEQYNEYLDLKEREKRALKDRYYDPKYEEKEGFRYFFNENYFAEYFIFNSTSTKAVKLLHSEVLLSNLYEAPITYFKFSPDGKYLTYSNRVQKTLIFDAVSGEIIKKFDNIINSAMTNDNKYLIGGGNNDVTKGELQKIDLKTGKKISTFKTLGDIKTFFNNDFLLVNSRSSYSVFDVKTSKKLIDKTFKIAQELGNVDDDGEFKITEKNLYVESDHLEIINLKTLKTKTIRSNSDFWDKTFFISDDERLYFNGTEIWDIVKNKIIAKFQVPIDKRKSYIEDYHTNSTFDYFTLIYGYRGLDEKSVEGNPLEDFTLKVYNRSGKEVISKNYGYADEFHHVASLITKDAKFLFINIDNTIEKFNLKESKLIYSLPVLRDEKHLDDVIERFDILGRYPFTNKDYVEDYYDYFVGKTIKKSKLKTVVENAVLAYNKKINDERNGIKTVENIYDGGFEEIRERNILGEDKNINQVIKTYKIRAGGNRINDKIFDSDNNIIASFRFDNFNNWIIQTPDNFFFASNDISKYLKYKVEGKIYNFDQFDLFFNRPDIVLERLGVTSKEVINRYKTAYEKRVEKMGFKLEDLKLDYEQPEISVLNDNIPFSTTKSKFNISYEAFDSKNKLDRINLYINDIPVYGMKGLDIKAKNIDTIKENIEITLSAGINKIELSVHNQNGVESKREIIDIFYQAPIKKPSLYVVSIGVSDYQNKDKTLKYAAKDASDIVGLFNTKRDNYEKVELRNLKNQDVTKEKVLAIRQLLSKTNVDDKVILFVSGHGILDNDKNDWYFASQDMDFQKPSLRGVSYNDLEGLLDGIPARNKLFLLDACHSGELDSEMNTRASNTKKVDNPITFDNQPKSKGGAESRTSALSNSFEAMKALFADTRRFSGANVISAASGDKKAFEGDEYNNGYFTYAFIDGIKTKKADKNQDGVIRVSELRDYIQKRVVEISKNKQVPTNRQENLANDFVIWTY